MTPTSHRAARVLLHCALAGGMLLSSPQDQPRSLQQLVQMNPMQFVHHAQQHLAHDWQVLCELTKRNSEELSIALHHIVQLCGDERDVAVNDREMGGVEWRARWEDRFTRCVDEVFSNLNELLAKHRAAVATGMNFTFLGKLLLCICLLIYYCKAVFVLCLYVCVSRYALFL